VQFLVIFNVSRFEASKFDFVDPLYFSLQWPAKKIIHHLNVSVKKALITHLDFDVTQK
jgi:hypothetical protein